MLKTPNVIIVGAGPAGLTLATELANAGVQTHIIERRSQPSNLSRAFGILPHTLELLDMRGRADILINNGTPWVHAPLGDGKHNLDFSRLQSRFPFMLIIPQCNAEAQFESMALKAGVKITRGMEVIDIKQNSQQVTTTVKSSEGINHLKADYVVGCDGVKSTIRQLLNIEFPGFSYDCTLSIADVHLTFPPDPKVYARTTKRGMVAVFPFNNGSFRIIVLDHHYMHISVDNPLTLTELNDSVQGILGKSLGIHHPIWMSRFRSEQRQAKKYQVGRVFLAGDAAHTHIPSGGQGLQIAIQDAINLGWKLVAVLKDHAPTELLQSYEQERRTINTKILKNTDKVFKYEISRSLPARILRRLSVLLMTVPFIQLLVIKQLSGVTLRYPFPKLGSHKIVGRRIPDIVLTDELGHTHRIYEMLRTQPFILIDQTTNSHFINTYINMDHEQLIVLTGQIKPPHKLPKALLIRPDGYILWATESENNTYLPKVLKKWLPKKTHKNQTQAA
ncbi:FAD-dependent monooxygenase [Zooshikella marina]|uniref:FAD-dependent monooxygenase n=1 Tax=Zooshikella ganghwensis TaxID=202772 RepID=UPI001BAF1D0E|nr:FAD-dependent monooxygenase [Zooshikella ganghwensis]MBU2705614.1 FAD-dependent monooxygenase [Zooshikella ganghwensis]